MAVQVKAFFIGCREGWRVEGGKGREEAETERRERGCLAEGRGERGPQAGSRGREGKLRGLVDAAVGGARETGPQGIGG